MTTDRTSHEERLLLCRAGSVLCGLLLPQVRETMRPLPIRPLGGLPPFVSGVSIIRGAPVPVVDAGALLGSRERGRPTRFVTLRLGDRSVALAVDEVLGVRDGRSLSLQGLPPLLTRMKPRVAALIGRVDAEFLAVLRDARFVPDRAWPAPGSDGEVVWPTN